MPVFAPISVLHFAFPFKIPAGALRLDLGWGTIRPESDQEGSVMFRYSIRPHQGCEAAEIKKFGLERSQPLVLAPSAGNSKRPTASLLEVEPSGVIVASLKPGADKKCWIAKLYNASGRPENIKLRGAIFREGSVYLSNPSEDRLERVRGPLPILPFGIVTVRVEK